MICAIQNLHSSVNQVQLLKNLKTCVDSRAHWLLSPKPSASTRANFPQAICCLLLLPERREALWLRLCFRSHIHLEPNATSAHITLLSATGSPNAASMRKTWEIWWIPKCFFLLNRLWFGRSWKKHRIFCGDALKKIALQVPDFQELRLAFSPTNSTWLMWPPLHARASPISDHPLKIKLLH